MLPKQIVSLVVGTCVHVITCLSAECTGLLFGCMLHSISIAPSEWRGEKSDSVVWRDGAGPNRTCGEKCVDAVLLQNHDYEDANFEKASEMTATAPVIMP